MDLWRYVHALRLNRLNVLIEQLRTVRVDEAGRMQANEFITSIAIHPARRRIGLDHKVGLQINDDQPVAGGFEDALILLFPLVSLR